MSGMFVTVLNMSLTASYVALAVMLVRLLLGKSPRVFSYALWLVVFVRLVLPVSLESNYSLVPRQTNAVRHEIIFVQSPDALADPVSVGGTVNGVEPAVTIPAGNEGGSAGENRNMPAMVVWMGTIIWLAGIVLLMIFSIVSYVRFKGRLAFATLVQGNVYESDRITGPFVLGFFRPRIYIPAGLGMDELDYVLRHEQTHIRRKDHLIKPLAYLAVILHWFNPLVWFSYSLMIKDMEMSCDESVIRQAGSDIRSSYSSSLLGFSMKQGGLLSPLCFGESNITARIKNILAYRSPKTWIAAVSFAVVIAVTAGCLTNAGGGGEERGNTTGNLINLGMAAQHGNEIYYSDMDLDTFAWSVYKVGTEGEPVEIVNDNDSALYLNVTDDWLYYRGDGYYIYKIRTDGSDRRRIGNDQVEGISVVDGWIYYSLYSLGGIYKIRTDGTERTEIIKGRVASINVVGDWVYYISGENERGASSIDKIRTDGDNATEVISEDLIVQINVDGDWIYYLLFDMEDDLFSIHKIRTDGSRKTRVVVDVRPNAIGNTLNVDGDWVYFAEKRGIFKVRTDGNELIKISEDQPYMLNVVGNRIFYIGGDDRGMGHSYTRLKKVYTDGSEADSPEVQARQFMMQVVGERSNHTEDDVREKVRGIVYDENADTLYISLMAEDSFSANAIKTGILQEAMNVFSSIYDAVDTVGVVHVSWYYPLNGRGDTLLENVMEIVMSRKKSDTLNWDNINNDQVLVWADDYRQHAVFDDQRP